MCSYSSRWVRSGAETWRDGSSSRQSPMTPRNPPGLDHCWTAFEVPHLNRILIIGIDVLAIHLVCPSCVRDCVRRVIVILQARASLTHRISNEGERDASCASSDFTRGVRCDDGWNVYCRENAGAQPAGSATAHCARQAVGEAGTDTAALTKLSPTDAPLGPNGEAQGKKEQMAASTSTPSVASG